MQKLMMVAFCAMTLALPRAAQAEISALSLPDFLQDCNTQKMSKACILRAWKYADVVNDGFMTSAEIGHLIRSISKPTLTKLGELKVDDPMLSKQFSSMKLIANESMAQSSQAILLDFDYDGDGKLSQMEFGGEYDTDQGSALLQMINSIQNLYKFASAVQGGVVEGKIKELGAGLSHVDVLPRRDLRNGVDYLVVSGKVKNISQQIQDVPTVLASLNNQSDEMVMSETYEINVRLAPGESTPFEVEFKNPPGTARNMVLGFVNSTKTQ